MTRGKAYMYAWLTIQWLVMLPAAAAFSYLFFADTHGLLTTKFYVCVLAIMIAVTIGYAIAVSVLRSWRESL